ncbi:SDR family NAD(P)-dependent oxidoreductase [Streptomyces sp. NBC_00162]|uniref:SDR family NAD(P)-dependent oxidoreductase n=1 Tax=Streptomyces sp. NBC_00162 TaxID=2903629 RepID=UPI003A4C7F18
MTALITGATEGIGRGLAPALAAEGRTVTAVARTEPHLRALMTELGPGGRRRSERPARTPSPHRRPRPGQPASRCSSEQAWSRWPTS